MESNSQPTMFHSSDTPKKPSVFHSTTPSTNGYFHTSPAPGKFSTDFSSDTSLKVSFDRHARPMLDTIDLIRSLGLEGRNFQLPKIVVIGDQSVGKSSCLEALSGIQLPRGDGIVTRTPLEKRMRTSTNGTAWRCRIRYTNHNGKPVEKEVTAPADVSQAVRDAQEDITGDKCGISDSLITLDVESPEVPDLTLIDLPGIARYSEENPLIEQQIIHLIKKYIKPEHTIILAVFPAGTDIDTVAAFRLARDVDPELKRTIGVITKMDLVGPGSEKFVIDTLTNKKVNLKLGMFAVKCRSQEDVERGIPLTEASRKEEEFFNQHPHFGLLNPSIFGIRRVSEKMVFELTTKIRDCLPEMSRIVNENLNRLKKSIEELGRGPPEDEEERRREFLSLLTEYTNIVEKVSSGHYRHHDNKMKLFSKWRNETHKFAERIREITNKGVEESLKHDSKILEELKEQRGSELLGFVNSYPVCESIIEYLLVQWSCPANEYVCSVSNHVENILRDLATETFDRFPKLGTKVKELVDERHQIAIEKTEADIKKLFMQEATVWTQDSTYLVELDTVTKDPEKSKPKVTDTDDNLTGWSRYVEGVMDGTSAYMRVASRRIMDTIPQCVLYYSLKVLPSEIKEYVLSIASNSLAINDLYTEREDIAVRRDTLTDEQQRWRKAEKQLAAL